MDTKNHKEYNMQEDMHYYGTYAMALAAGIPDNDAQTIAYSAQFVDDSTAYDSDLHSDGGLLHGVTTAHNNLQVVQNIASDLLDNAKQEGELQRKMWVPFHFFPGGIGDTFQEKLLCVKDSDIVREMFTNHIEVAAKKQYGLELMGIAAHTYMDTFSHYGFSGISSKYNRVKQGTLGIIGASATIKEYIENKFSQFMANVAGTIELGHGGVETYPDRPYLHWQFNFVEARPGNGTLSSRENSKNFLEGCKKLHLFFMEFARSRYAESTPTSFNAIEDTVRDILEREGKLDSRISLWKNSKLIPSDANYSPTDWEKDKTDFHRYSMSREAIESNTYKFHQAACYHRYYSIKDLLPSHGIPVY